MKARELRKFIISNPSGVTHADIKSAGLSCSGLDILKRNKAIRCEQEKEKDGSWHWRYFARPLPDLGETK